MAKKKKVSKKKKSRRRGLMVLAVMGLIVGAIVAAGVLMRPKKEVPVQAQILARFGAKGAGPGQMDSPRGAAMDKAGNVYVADLGNSRINKYSRDGAFLLSIGKHGLEQGKNGPGEFREPSGVAVDSEGRVYVADSWNGRIQKFDAKGHFLAEFGGPRYGFYSPRNVAVDQAGNFYVADTGNSVVKAYNPAGGLIKEVGGRGKGGGRFDEVFGIAVNSKGEIFVADPNNRRVHKFSALPEAKFLKDIKVPGWQEQSPFWPHLAADSSDRIYAADNANRKIWVYSSELAYLGTIGGQPGKELFGNPCGIAASGAELAVADLGNNQVVRLGNIVVPEAK